MLGINFGDSETTAEGWFGKGKASVMASVVTLISIILAVAIVPLVLFLGNRGSTPSEMPSGSPGTHQVQAGTVQIPDGQKIKVVLVDFPPELKITWEELLKRNIGLSPAGTLKNISDKTVAFNEITFVLDGEEIGTWNPPFLEPSPASRTMDRGLKPGQETRVMQEMFGWSEASKVLEARMVNFRVIDSSTTAPTTAIPAQVPKETTEVVIKWYELLKAGKFTEALDLYTPEVRRSFSGAADLKERWQKDKITKLVVKNATIEDDYARVIVTMDSIYGIGDEENFDVRRMSGVWKIEESPLN